MPTVSHIARLAIVCLAVQAAPSAPASSYAVALQARQDTPAAPVAPGETNLFKDVVPKVIAAGPITDAQVADIINNPLPPLSVVVADAVASARRGLGLRVRQNPDPPTTVDETSLAQPTTNFILTYHPNIPDIQQFDIVGPFRSIELGLGGSIIRGIVVTDDEGIEHVAGELLGTRQKFTFEDGEFITEFNVFGQDDNGNAYDPAGTSFTTGGISFKTSNGRAFEALGSTVAASPDRFKPNPIPIGSGILGRLRGSAATPGTTWLLALNIDFIDTFTDVEIVDIVYDDFNDKLFPAGPGVTLSAGSQALDNRNGSITQKIILKLTRAVAKQTTFAFSVTSTVGGSVSVAAKAEIPFIASSTVTGTVSWSLALATTKTDQDTTTFTQEQTFELSCPATKFCRAQATFIEYKLDVGFTAIFAAQTKQGKQFTWKKRGTFTGSQATDAKLTVEEYDSAPAAARR